MLRGQREIGKDVSNTNRKVKVEVLALNGRQKKRLSGRPSKRRKIRIIRRNKTAKAIIRYINKLKRTVLRVNNLPNNITNALEKKEPWKSKVSIHQHSSPESRFAKMRLSERHKPGD